MVEDSDQQEFGVKYHCVKCCSVRAIKKLKIRDVTLLDFFNYIFQN